MYGGQSSKVTVVIMYLKIVHSLDISLNGVSYKFQTWAMYTYGKSNDPIRFLCMVVKGHRGHYVLENSPFLPYLEMIDGHI